MTLRALTTYFVRLSHVTLSPTKGDMMEKAC